MNTVTLVIDRDELVTINTALAIYCREVKGLNDHDKLMYYNSKISVVKFKVDKGFRELEELEKQEVKE